MILTHSRKKCEKFLLVAVCLVGLVIIAGHPGRPKSAKVQGQGALRSQKGRGHTNAQAIMARNKGLHRTAVEEVSPLHLREVLRDFTKEPHSPGSKESYQLALKIKEKWLDYKFDKVELKKYNVLLSFPEKPGLVTVHYPNGTRFYRNTPVDGNMDPAYNDPRVLPPFNAYSPAGSVTGKLVFANYGRNSDYATLKDKGINVTGKIVISRYGKSSRVIQHGRAYRNGAIGLILYMDPQDHAKQGMDKVYPKYNWLPKNAVERGTLKYSKYRGDPLTPGYPAVDEMYRIPVEQAKKDLPQIPVQPMSYQDAEPLLRMLKGSVGKSSWQGGLDFTYGVYMDENDTRVVNLTVSTVLKPYDIYNVIGTIQGTVEPDHLVILGNHRDGWIYGAADPSSGTSAMMETSRVIGNMMKKGWKPRRSLVFCSWGAEEPQLMGSAEWEEDYAKLLHRRAVAYLNVDMSVDGAYSFRAKSMPSMDWILFEATKQVKSPLGNETVFEEWKRKLPETSIKYPVPKQFPRVQEIRAGSDYVVFYQRLGIPCIDIRYTYDRATSDNPLYHTIYDNFYMMSKLIDPDFKYHQVTTRVWTQIALTMSDSFVIPLNVTHYAKMMSYYSKRVDNTYGTRFRANNVTMDGLNYAIANFTKQAETFQKFIDETNLNKESVVRRINERLVNLERAFIHDHVIIPSKPLQRHVMLNPAVNKVTSWMGGVVEAVYRAESLGRPWTEVQEQLAVVQYAVNSASHILSMYPI